MIKYICIFTAVIKLVYFFMAEIYNHKAIKLMAADNVAVNILALVDLQFQTGIRISDLLSIDFSNVTDRLHIVIEQGKGSRKLVVSPVNFRDYWKSVRVNKLNPSAGLNRFFFYRLYKKYGIEIDRGANKNKSVTHAPRKLIGKELYNRENKIEDVQAGLGHRSKRSSEFYI